MTKAEILKNLKRTNLLLERTLPRFVSGPQADYIQAEYMKEVIAANNKVLAA